MIENEHSPNAKPINKVCNAAYTFSIRKNLFSSSKESLESGNSSLLETKGPQSLQKIHNILQNNMSRDKSDGLIKQASSPHLKRDSIQRSQYNEAFAYSIETSKACQQQIGRNSEPKNLIATSNSLQNRGLTPLENVRSEYQLDFEKQSTPIMSSDKLYQQNPSFQSQNMYTAYENVQKEMKV